MALIDYKKLTFFETMTDVVAVTYQITKKFPKDEHGFNGLVNQMRRAAVSAVSNLAEGSSRKNKELVHFLVMALGSLREVDAQLEIVRKLGYVNEEEFKKLFELLDESIRKLYRYTETIKNNPEK